MGKKLSPLSRPNADVAKSDGLAKIYQSHTKYQLHSI